MTKNFLQNISTFEKISLANEDFMAQLAAIKMSFDQLQQLVSLSSKLAECLSEVKAVVIEKDTRIQYTDLIKKHLEH